MAAAAVAGCQSKSVIDPVSPPAITAFPPQLVATGERLAAIGNCITCHTAKGGKPYAGGFPIQTPFGIVHGTNLTPDAATGLGTWSEDAFRRAMHDGVDREGRHLYPAFPYDHFTLLSDDDVRALYAFLMTRDPVRAPVPANSVIVPRALVAIWKSLYFRPGRFAAEAARASRLSRGHYLAEALAHCSACHTPRNALGAEKKRDAYAGGEVAGWHAPALNSASTSPIPWTVDAMTAYLRSGIADDHAIAAGPMAGVVRNLATVPADEIAAIALYAVSLDTRNEDQRKAQAAHARALPAHGKADEAHPGARLYAGSCADCHDRGREAEGGALRLPLAIAPTLPTPANLIRIVRDGIVPRAHERNGWMPPFAGALTDDELAEVVGYVRTFSGYPPWSDVPGAVRAATKVSE